MVNAQTCVSSPPPPPPSTSMPDRSAATTANANNSDRRISPDESVIDQLLATESDHLPQSDYILRCRNHSFDTTARQDAINWILKVNRHYQFKPVTAILAVNYLDRILSIIPPPENWAFQLLSAASLSVAAKMEEPLVPLLTELQVFTPFVFESKHVQRMEIRLLSKLKWRLHSITPFDYLNYFISKLLPVVNVSSSKLQSNASILILNSTRGTEFLAYKPSEIAAAVVISAAGKDIDTPESYYEKLSQEKVISCHQLIERFLIDPCPSGVRIAEPPSSPPSSPDTVLTAGADCASCTGSGRRHSHAGSGNQNEQSTTANVQEEQP